MKPVDTYSDNEAQVRFQRLLKAAVNTPPAPLKSMAPIGVPAQQKKRGKKSTDASSDASSASAKSGRRGGGKQA